MPIYDFICDKCTDKLEKLVKSDVTGVTCPCGGLMKRQISCPQVKLDGTDPDFPGAYAKWGRDREKRAAQHRKKSYYEG